MGGVTEFPRIGAAIGGAAVLPIAGHLAGASWGMSALVLAATLAAVALWSESRRTRELKDELAAARAARAAAEEQVRLVLQVSSSGIAVVDAEGVITMANQRAEQIFGYPSTALIGVPLEDLVPPAARDRHRALRRGYSESGQVRQMSDRRTVRGRRRDGTELALFVSLLPIDSPRGRLVYVNLEDISQQHAAEQARERERERFLQLALATKDTVWEWDVAADKIWLSSTMQEAYFWKVEGLVDRPWMRARIHPEDLPRMADSMAEAVAEGRALWICEYRFRRADGGYRDVLMRAAMVRDERGQLQRVTGIMLDLTERIAMERELRERTAELERSNGDLERFAQVASHDLQEPLRTISSFVQLLAKRYSAVVDDEGRRFIAYAVDGAKRMRALIDALLAYARIDRREGQADGRVELDEVMLQVRADLRSALLESGAMLTTDRLPAVRGAEPQLAQLMQNLVGNALKYRRDVPPQIHISAQPAGAEGWRISVADNGIGIEEQYFERIFAVFQRLHTRDAYEGTGIGLAICKRIVERHGGRIWLDSVVGRGSTFHITLPSAADERTDERIA